MHPCINYSCYCVHIADTPVNEVIYTAVATDPDPNAVLVYEVIEPILAWDKNNILLNSQSSTNYKVKLIPVIYAIYVCLPMES